MSKSVIFMQASVKMNAVLNCYEAEREKGRDVTILLPFVLRDTKKFIDEIHLDAHTDVMNQLADSLLFMAMFPLIYKNRIKRNLAHIGIDDDTHFFFTDHNDTEIGLLLPYLKNNEPTQIQTTIDINDGIDYQRERKSSSGIRILISKILSFLYNTHFIAVHESGLEFIYTDQKKYNLAVLDYSDKSIIDKYRIKVADSPNCVLFYTSPYLEQLFEEEEYDRLNKEIIEILHKKGYKVFVKSHPRFSDSKIVKDLADEIIPSYIPGEYIDLTSFNFAIGLSSTIIATACEVIPSYSVLNVGRVKNITLRDSYIKYITDINPNVCFIVSLNELPDYSKKNL